MAEASSTEDVITLRIRFKSETLERFIERYGGDLGPDEVFVRTRQPLAGGTHIAFDFTLNDGSPLLDGRGTVIWTRQAEQAADGPPGMGIKFTSLSAASWQILRKILAASGREGEDVTPPPVPTVSSAPGTILTGAPAFTNITNAADVPSGASAARRATPLGPPAVAVPVAPAAGRATAQAGGVHEPAREEDADRTEVARMPPNFFELAAEGGPRNLAPAREPVRRGVEIGIGRDRTEPAPDLGRPSLKTPRRGVPAPQPYEREPIEALGLEDVEDVEDATNVHSPSFPAPSFAAPGFGSAPRSTPARSPAVRPEPQWPTSPTPLTSPAVDPSTLGLTAARTGASRTTSPSQGVTLPLTSGQAFAAQAPARRPGTPGQGVSTQTGGPAPQRSADPGLSTAPTLPATAAVLLYDPDDPAGGLVPADQASGVPQSMAQPGSGRIPSGATTHLGLGGPSGSQNATGGQPMGRADTRDSSGLFFGPPGGGGAGLPPGYQTRLAQPGAEGPRYPEAGFDDSRPSAFGPRPTVGRIGPAISPEEMALASSAVRGMENDMPLWPGQQQEELDGPRGGTFKIWLALTLAAGGLIGAVLWLLPLMWPGVPTVPPVPPAGESTAAEAGKPAAAPGTAPAAGEPTSEQAAQNAAKAALAAATAGSGAATANPGEAAGAEAAATPPAKAGGEAPAGKAEGAATSGRAGKLRAAAEDDKPSPRPSRRKVRRDPGEVIAEAEGRDRDRSSGSALPSGTPAAPTTLAPPTTAGAGSPAASGSGAGTTSPSGVASGIGGAAGPGAATRTPTSPASGTAPAPAAAASSPPPVDEEDAFWLSVRSTPSGADVLIDGQIEGKTPFQRRIFDPARSYTLVVRKAGFTSIERAISGSSEWSKRGNLHTLTVTAKLDPNPSAAPEAPAPGTPSLTPPPTPAPPASGKTNPFDEPPAPGAKP
jgi:uncharacterized protein (TIGR02266 family)